MFEFTCNHLSINAAQDYAPRTLFQNSSKFLVPWKHIPQPIKLLYFTAVPQRNWCEGLRKRMFSGYVHHWGKIPGLQILGPKKGHGPNLGISEKPCKASDLVHIERKLRTWDFSAVSAANLWNPPILRRFGHTSMSFLAFFLHCSWCLRWKEDGKQKAKCRFSWLQTHGFPPWRLGGSSSRALRRMKRQVPCDMTKLMDWWWDWIMFGGMIMIMMIMMIMMGWLWWLWFNCYWRMIIWFQYVCRLLKDQWPFDYDHHWSPLMRQLDRLGPKGSLPEIEPLMAARQELVCLYLLWFKTMI